MRTSAGVIGLAIGVGIAAAPFMARAQTAPESAIPPDSKPMQLYVINKGVPYSGVRVVRSVTIFPNGYRKVEVSTTKEWRDSEGRTRNDITWMRPDGSSVTVCQINDPVELVRYIWKVEPTARTVVTETHYKMDGIIEESWPHSVEEYEIDPESGKRIVLLAPTQEPNIKYGSLGPEYINGVYAEGDRDVEAIPPGRGGNASDHPVYRVDEIWMSPDLEMPVKLFLDDGLGFTQSVELKNIDRSEADASVFRPPEGLSKREAPESDPVWKEPAGVN